jgi:hypothetical protein
MREEAQFLVDLQHESNKIPETNKNFNGEYIARIYGGGCVPYTLVEKDGRVSKGTIEKLEVNGKVIFQILYSNGVNSGRKFNSFGFEISK